MGKVASDKCHKWVFKEPSECEANISNYWQSSFDAVCTLYSAEDTNITGFLGFSVHNPCNIFTKLRRTTLVFDALNLHCSLF